MDNIEEKILRNIKKKFLALVEKEFEKAGYDRVFWDFKLYAVEYNIALEKVREHELIDEEKEGKYCIFCGKPARFYAKDFGGFICPSCFRKVWGDNYAERR